MVSNLVACSTGKSADGVKFSGIKIQTQLRDLAAGIRPSFAIDFPSSNRRGRGVRWVPDAPAASHAKKNARACSLTGSPGWPSVPTQRFLPAYFVISPVTGLVCHRRQRTRVLSKPGWADLTSVDLTPASGRQNHTTSPSAIAPFVCSPPMTHGKPALPPRVVPMLSTSIASRSAFVTSAKRPSVERDRREYRGDSRFRKTEYILFWGWTWTPNQE
jgi:hypothetical protein